LVSTGVPSLDHVLGDEGYPDRSSILVIGPPGVGKEALGYWFVHSGLTQGDFCLYTTHRSVSDVLRDMKGVGIPSDNGPDWIASSGSQVRCDLRDVSSISFSIKDVVHRNKQRRVRVTTDVMSPLLVLNPLESMYAFWSNLISDIKQQDSVILALAEDGMHPPNTLATMEQLFDGVLELSLYREGLAVTPLFLVKKMLGMPPIHGYLGFSISKTGMEVAPHVH
jgi:circadian clock protein KaiC